MEKIKVKIEKKLYIKISRYEEISNADIWTCLGSYIQPVSEVANAIDGEMDSAHEDSKFKIELTPVFMTEEEYRKLPEFTGY